MPTSLKSLPASLSALACALAVAAPRDIALPTETVTLRSAPVPGATLAASKCMICHSADYIAYQPPGLGLSAWTAEVTKMQRAYGAPLTDDEVKAIGAYLAVAYGSAHASDPEIKAAGAASAASAADASH